MSDDPRDDKAAYTPDEDQIRYETALLRQGWSRKKLRKRGPPQARVSLKEIADPLGGTARLTEREYLP